MTAFEPDNAIHEEGAGGPRSRDAVNSGRALSTEARPDPAGVLRHSNGRWAKGAVPNPLGRAPSQRRILGEKIDAQLSEEADDVVAAVLEKAKAGDIQACKVVLDRVAPPRKSRPLDLQWPDLVDLRTCDVAMVSLLRSVSEGGLTIDEGAGMAALLAERRQSLLALAMEDRLRTLEGQVVDQLDDGGDQ